jgi:hypothetical protein
MKQILLSIAALIVTSANVSAQTAPAADRFPPKPQPENYVCYRTPTPIVVDGKLDEEAWAKVPWTQYFRDIQGSVKPDPQFKTRVKVLWDDENIYFAAQLEEPHVWAKLMQRDTIIYFDNDFEIFIDPDGDTHQYYEFEVNAFGTPWDLLMTKPYRDGGLPIFGWDIAGLQVGVHVDGTINDPSDTDEGWSLEIVMPLAALRECDTRGRLPEPGTQWRLGFSRVQWQTCDVCGMYEKILDPKTGRPYPEDNWVWSPQGRVNMHMPEMWGYLQFSGLTVGEGTDEFVLDPRFDERWALWTVYYAQGDFFRKNRKYADNLDELGLSSDDLPTGLANPVIMTTRTTWECHFPDSPLTIFNDGKIAEARGRRR